MRCMCVCVYKRIMVCVFAIIINSSMSKFVNEVLRLWSEENRFSVKLTQSNVARCLLEINLLPRPLYFYHVCLSVCLAADNLHCDSRYLMQTHGVCVCVCVRQLKSIIRSVSVCLATASFGFYLSGLTLCQIFSSWLIKLVDLLHFHIFQCGLSLIIYDFWAALSLPSFIPLP